MVTQVEREGPRRHFLDAKSTHATSKRRAPAVNMAAFSTDAHGAAIAQADFSGSSWSELDINFIGGHVMNYRKTVMLLAAIPYRRCPLARGQRPQGAGHDFRAELRGRNECRWSSPQRVERSRWR